jgi:hypothetical protein
MTKKRIWITALLTLVMAFGLARTAIAAGDDAPANHQGGPGKGNRSPKGKAEVISIGDDQFTAETPNGTEITVLVDADTRYFGDLESFNDIEVGMEVAVMGARQGDQTVLAKVVGAGDEFPLGQRAGGEVIAIDSDSLTIENRQGESLTFQVDGETLSFSRDDEVQALSDIEIGDHVKIHYEEASDGTLLAKSIGAGGPRIGKGPKGPGNRPQGGQNS